MNNHYQKLYGKTSTANKNGRKWKKITLASTLCNIYCSNFYVFFISSLQNNIRYCDIFPWLYCPFKAVLGCCGWPYSPDGSYRGRRRNTARDRRRAWAESACQTQPSGPGTRLWFSPAPAHLRQGAQRCQWGGSIFWGQTQLTSNYDLCGLPLIYQLGWQRAEKLRFRFFWCFVIATTRPFKPLKPFMLQ